MKHQIRFYILAIILLVPVTLVDAQEKTGVLLEVTTNQKTPDEVKTRFTNFVKGKLLKLDDVELVKDNEDYKIKYIDVPEPE